MNQLTPELVGAYAAAIVLIIGTLTTSIISIIKLFSVGAQVTDNTTRTNAVHAQTIALNAQTQALNDKTNAVMAATAVPPTVVVNTVSASPEPPTPPDKVIVP